MPALTDDARAEALTDLTAAGWSLRADRDAIEKTFKFKSFAQAFGWMSQIAIEAEKLDHHPEWFNVYSKVEVVLTTHDVNGLSELDVKLAKIMDAAAS
ncbi:MAG: 4a-hydroxytetrahydrobiopterin dehydratase [Pseudomonadota bacterium]